ncbi:MAG: hypothetical protein ACKV2Q_22820 [Planctomycetaceae bacterium]
MTDLTGAKKTEPCRPPAAQRARHSVESERNDYIPPIPQLQQLS